jgi:hypothetical protein
VRDWLEAARINGKPGQNPASTALLMKRQNGGVPGSVDATDGLRSSISGHRAAQMRIIDARTTLVVQPVKLVEAWLLLR